jgi:hypothetical protein
MIDLFPRGIRGNGRPETGSTLGAIWRGALHCRHAERSRANRSFTSLKTAQAIIIGDPALQECKSVGTKGGGVFPRYHYAYFALHLLGGLANGESLARSYINPHRDACRLQARDDGFLIQRTAIHRRLAGRPDPFSSWMGARV